MVALILFFSGPIHMFKEDARFHTLEQLHERRKRVVRLHCNGLGVMQIVECSGLSYPTVRAAIDAFERGGMAAIRPRPRGKSVGNGRSLTEDQERKIRQIICEKRPEQLQMNFALWSRAALKKLIEQECGVSLSVRAVGMYSVRWGFNSPTPIKRRYAKQSEAVRAWLGEHYPVIAALAKAEDAEIHWGDETAWVDIDVCGRSDMLVGNTLVGNTPAANTPVGNAPGTYAAGEPRPKRLMIAAVTNQGKARWMMIDKSINADQLIVFLAALIKDAKRKVFLILDNLRVHHCKLVKAWQAAHANQIEVFYLPSASQALNPARRLNTDLRHAIGLGARVPAQAKDKLKIVATEHMTNRESLPAPLPASLPTLLPRLLPESVECYS